MGHGHRTVNGKNKNRTDQCFLSGAIHTFALTGWEKSGSMLIAGFKVDTWSQPFQPRRVELQLFDLDIWYKTGSLKYRQKYRYNAKSKGYGMFSFEGRRGMYRSRLWGSINTGSVFGGENSHKFTTSAIFIAKATKSHMWNTVYKTTVIKLAKLWNSGYTAQLQSGHILHFCLRNTSFKN